MPLPQQLGYGSAHRVPDGDDAPQAEVLDECRGVVGAVLQREAPRVPDAPSVTAVIEGDDVEPVGQGRVGAPPAQIGVRRPAVQQEQRRGVGRTGLPDEGGPAADELEVPALRELDVTCRGHIATSVMPCRYGRHTPGTLGPVKRLLVLFVLPVLGLALLPSAASAQEEPLLTPVVDGLEEGLAQLDPVLEGLAPVTDQLDPVLAELITQLGPLFDALQTAVAAAEPACAVLGPLQEQLAPVLTEIQPLLDLVDPETGPAQLDTLDPLLTEVDALLDQVTTLCAAQAETTTTTAAPTTTTAPPPPADTLPRTGGDLLLPGVGLLSAAGAVFAARKRLQ